jgi:small conductance mechanosensitive channel
VFSSTFIQYQRCCQSKFLRRFIIGSIAILIVLISPAIDQPASGQLPSLTFPTRTQPPASVERSGALEAVAVRLDGEELFTIASPAVLDRSQTGIQIPVEVRASQVEANLKPLIVGNRLLGENRLDPNTMQISIERVNGQPVLFVKDATLAEAKALITVTNTDAQYYSISPDKLADRWKVILEEKLREALELRQPEALQRQTATVSKILAITALLTLVLGGIWTLFDRRRQQLEQREAAELTAMQASRSATGETDVIESSNAEQGRLQGLQQHLGIQQRLQIVRFLRWLLFWAIAFVWGLGIAYSLDAFAQTRQFAERVITIPLVILFTWFLTGLVNRLTDFAVDRFIQGQQQDQSLTEANLQRMTTVANVLKGLKMVLIYIVGILCVLEWLKLTPGSVLVLGALAALTVSFTVQSLVKDLANGFLILLEDQFRIGDYVRVNTAAGYVENLNLRITQIRSDDGNLITLPNSLIAQVENMSRTWARTDFRIEVAYHTDVDHALAVVRETVDRMAQDPEWRTLILDTQELFGVDQISHTGIVIRIWIKTAPLKQWMTARELRRRLKIAFDHHHIQIGIPQQIWLDNLVESGQHN